MEEGKTKMLTVLIILPILLTNSLSLANQIDKNSKQSDGSPEIVKINGNN